MLVGAGKSRGKGEQACQQCMLVCFKSQETTPKRSFAPTVTVPADEEARGSLEVSGTLADELPVETGVLSSTLGVASCGGDSRAEWVGRGDLYLALVGWLSWKWIRHSVTTLRSLSGAHPRTLCALFVVLVVFVCSGFSWSLPSGEDAVVLHTFLSCSPLMRRCGVR